MTPSFTLTPHGDDVWTVTGELADLIRAELEAGQHAQVLVHIEWEYTGCGDGCCHHTDRTVTFEAGEVCKQFYDNDHGSTLPLDRIMRWLDAPAYEAAAAAEWLRRESERAERRRIAEQQLTRQTTLLAETITAVEARGYRSDGEWHDQIMDALHIPGARYTNRPPVQETP